MALTAETVVRLAHGDEREPNLDGSVAKLPSKDIQRSFRINLGLRMPTAFRRERPMRYEYSKLRDHGKLCNRSSFAPARPAIGGPAPAPRSRADDRSRRAVSWAFLL